jgi:hypothetical protein
MLNFISRHRMVVWFSLVLLFVSLACLTSTNNSPVSSPEPSVIKPEVTSSSLPVTPEPSVISDSLTPSPEPEVVAGTPTPTPNPGVITIPESVVLGPGSFDFLDLKVGLLTLSSYQATLSLSFVGTEAGQPSQWSQSYIMLNTVAQGARHLTITQSGQVDNPSLILMAEVAGTTYEQNNEGNCIATVTEPENSLGEQMEPVSFLSGIVGAEEVGSETLNGAAANHYRFDEQAVGQLGVAEATGELWVAAEGGYILKYVLTLTGGADYFGPGVEGTATWNYELTNINQPLTIELPANCPAGLINVPLLPDAFDVTQLPGLLSYTTFTSVADAAAFYQAQLPALGWQQMADSFLDETVAVLDFTQADQLLTLILSVDDGQTTVNIAVGKP